MDGRTCMIFCLWAHEPVIRGLHYFSAVSGFYWLKNPPRKLGRHLLLSDNNSPSSSSCIGHPVQEGSHNSKIKFTHKHSADISILIWGLMVSHPELYPMSWTVTWIFRHLRLSPLGRGLPERGTPAESVFSPLLRKPGPWLDLSPTPTPPMLLPCPSALWWIPRALRQHPWISSSFA